MYIMYNFWHKNLDRIPHIIENFASANLPIKGTQARGYKVFHEHYLHDIEGGFVVTTV